jgi:hypothetical protein
MTLIFYMITETRKTAICSECGLAKVASAGARSLKFENDFPKVRAALHVLQRFPRFFKGKGLIDDWLQAI